MEFGFSRHTKQLNYVNLSFACCIVAMYITSACDVSTRSAGRLYYVVVIFLWRGAEHSTILFSIYGRRRMPPSVRKYSSRKFILPSLLGSNISQRQDSVLFTYLLCHDFIWIINIYYFFFSDTKIIINRKSCQTEKIFPTNDDL